MRRLVLMVIAASMASLAVACGGGGGDQADGGGGGGGTTVQLVARDISFDKGEITLAAGGEATIELDNQDQGLPHNFAMYEDDSAEKAIFQGDIIEGPDTAEYSFTAPDAGTYFFRCDVHPTEMIGTVVVE